MKTQKQVEQDSGYRSWLEMYPDHHHLSIGRTWKNTYCAKCGVSFYIDQEWNRNPDSKKACTVSSALYLAEYASLSQYLYSLYIRPGYRIDSFSKRADGYILHYHCSGGMPYTDTKPLPPFQGELQCAEWTHGRKPQPDNDA